MLVQSLETVDDVAIELAFASPASMCDTDLGKLMV